MDTNNINKPNRHIRRASKKHQKNKGVRLLDRPATEAEIKEARKEQSYKDPKKIFRKNNPFREMWEKVKKSHEHFDLPEKVNLERQPGIQKCIVINKDGRSRELLPDVPGKHKILCKGKLARFFKSDVCIFTRITQPGDGSWAICPAELAMATRTTIQTVKRRSWWWLRRYSYEISFDGRVQPASLFWDYGINPERESLSMYITYETIRVKGTGEINEYFRFWRDKPSK